MPLRALPLFHLEPSLRMIRLRNVSTPQKKPLEVVSAPLNERELGGDNVAAQPQATLAVRTPPFSLLCFDRQRNGGDDLKFGMLW